jgi:hypothetical protein
MIRNGTFGSDLRQRGLVSDLPALEHDAAIVLVQPYRGRSVMRAVWICADEP